MSPSENIYFFLIGAIVLTMNMAILLIFRKRKKWAIVLKSVVVIGDVGYYVDKESLKVIFIHLNGVHYTFLKLVIAPLFNE